MYLPGIRYLLCIAKFALCAEDPILIIHSLPFFTSYFLITTLITRTTLVSLKLKKFFLHDWSKFKIHDGMFWVKFNEAFLLNNFSLILNQKCILAGIGLFTINAYLILLAWNFNSQYKVAALYTSLTIFLIL